MILIVILYALWAVSSLIGKALLGYTQPVFLTGARMTLGGVVLLGYQYFYARNQFKIKRKHIWLYVQMTIFGIYITYILKFWGLNYMTASKTAFLYNFGPFMSSLFSYLLFTEKMSRKKWLGLSIGFIGLIPVLLTSSPVEGYLGELAFISWPEFAVLLSVASHSYSWVLMRKLIRDKNYSPAMINGIAMFCGGVLALGTSAFFESPTMPAPFLSFGGLLVLGTLTSNIICYNIYGYLLRNYSATFLSFCGFMGPLFTAFLGWLWLGESITWHYYLSYIVVFIGLYLFYQEELGKKKKEKAVEQKELYFDYEQK